MKVAYRYATQNLLFPSHSEVRLTRTLKIVATYRSNFQVVHSENNTAVILRKFLCQLAHIFIIYSLMSSNRSRVTSKHRNLKYLTLKFKVNDIYDLIDVRRPANVGDICKANEMQNV